jgi:transcriptional regulator with XRE-family HTH domain
LKTLGQILKVARETKGLLMREVAAAINADTSMISKFEKGERKPTRDQITLLSKALDINEKEILVTFLSDKIVSDLANEDVANEVLHAVEKKIGLIKRKNSI